MCKAGSHGGPREWEGRGEGCEERDRVRGYGLAVVTPGRYSGFSLLQTATVRTLLFSTHGHGYTNFNAA